VRRCAAIVAGWLLVAGQASAAGLHLPTTARQWAGLVLAGALYVVFQGLGEWLFSRRRGEAISARRFSPYRIVFGVFAGALLVLAWLALARWLQAL
jgi:hypothetical protein